MPILGGYAWSVPLWGAHPGTRGQPALDCLHHCHPGLPELSVYELARAFKAGEGGVRPLAGAADGARLACTPTPGGYRRRRL